MKFITYVIIILLLVFGAGMSYLYFELLARNKQLTVLFEESRNIKSKLQEEVAQIKVQQESVEKENEQLKKETLNYLKQQQDINAKRRQLEEAVKQQVYEVRDLNKQIQQERQKLEDLEQKNLKLGDINDLAGNTLLMKQKTKITELENQLASLKRQYNKQEALLHYNLGVSYTKDKNYEMALDEYEKALSLNPEDADTHYNLGVIYGDWRKNPKRAIAHYKKYLELRPDAPDIDEVKEWIARLEN